MKLATLCYVRQDGKTLMVHRIKKQNDIHAGKWNGLGGKLEPGETPEECAIREIREESGLQVRALALKGILTFPKFAHDEDWYAFVFVAGVEGGQSTSERGQSTSEGGQSTSEGGQSTSEGGQSTSEGGQSTSEGGQSTSEGGQSTSVGGQSTSVGEMIDSPEGDLEWIDDERLHALNLWEGDRIFLPWLDRPGFFSGKFVYQDGGLVDHSVVFYD